MFLFGNVPPFERFMYHTVKGIETKAKKNEKRCTLSDLSCDG